MLTVQNVGTFDMLNEHTIYSIEGWFIHRSGDAVEVYNLHHTYSVPRDDWNAAYVEPSFLGGEL